MTRLAIRCVIVMSSISSIDTILRTRTDRAGAMQRLLFSVSSMLNSKTPHIVFTPLTAGMILVAYSLNLNSVRKRRSRWKGSWTGHIYPQTNIHGMDSITDRQRFRLDQLIQ